MKHWLTAFSLLALSWSGLTLAEETDKSAASAKIALLGMEVISIADSPVPGLLQALTDRGLFYVSDDAKYLMHGRMYNMDAGMRNETEQALANVRLEGVQEFADDMIVFKAKDEKYVVSVFTDITCGYCRKLHKEIKDYNDLGITVRYMAFPRGGLQSGSYHDMVSVWCADDKQAALTEAKAGNSVETSSCENTIAKQYAFGQQVGVTGTPAVVLSDGSMIPGYQPADRMVQALRSL